MEKLLLPDVPYHYIVINSSISARGQLLTIYHIAHKEILKMNLNFIKSCPPVFVSEDHF